MMQMVGNVQVVRPPSADPVSIEMVRRHCRIDQTTDDVLLKSYLGTARLMAERYLSRSLITQTLLWTARPQSVLTPRLHFDRSEISLPRAPVQSVQSVTILDELGNTTAVSPATLPVVPPKTLNGYIADTSMQPALLTIGGETLMTDGRTLRHVNLRHIQVQFVAGYGDDFKSVPPNIIQAILLTVGSMYEHRGDETESVGLSQAAQWLLDPDRIHWLD